MGGAIDLANGRATLIFGNCVGIYLSILAFHAGGDLPMEVYISRSCVQLHPIVPVS